MRFSGLFCRHGRDGANAEILNFYFVRGPWNKASRVYVLSNMTIYVGNPHSVRPSPFALGTPDQSRRRGDRDGVPGESKKNGHLRVARLRYGTARSVS